MNGQGQCLHKCYLSHKCTFFNRAATSDRKENIVWIALLKRLRGKRIPNTDDRCLSSLSMLALKPTHPPILLVCGTISLGGRREQSDRGEKLISE
jgi:hypothetical protein